MTCTQGLMWSHSEDSDHDSEPPPNAHLLFLPHRHSFPSSAPTTMCINSCYRMPGKTGPKMTSSAEHSDSESQFRLMWDIRHLPAVSFLQMVHQQPGEMFGAGKAGFTAGLPHSSRPAVKAWWAEHSLSPHLGWESVQCMPCTAVHSGLALLNTYYVPCTLLKTFPQSLTSSPISIPHSSLLSLCNIIVAIHLFLCMYVIICLISDLYTKL